MERRHLCPCGAYRGDVLLLLVAVVWGSSYLAAQRTAVALGVLPVLALRFGIAALALTVVCLVSGRWRPCSCLPTDCGRRPAAMR